MTGAAVSGGQQQTRQHVAFAYAANAQQAIICLLIGRACVPRHPDLAVVGADEISQQVEVVGTESEHLLFDGRGIGRVGTAGRVGIALSHGLEPLAPRAKQCLMPRLVPLEHGEQGERARQLMAETAPLLDCVHAIHVARAARPRDVRRLGNIVAVRAVVGLHGTLKRGMRLAEIVPAPGQVQQSCLGRSDLARDARNFRADLQAVAGDGLPALGNAQGFVFFGCIGMILGLEPANPSLAGTPAVAVTCPASAAHIPALVIDRQGFNRFTGTWGPIRNRSDSRRRQPPPAPSVPDRCRGA